jgi:hypothetical protein
MARAARLFVPIFLASEVSEAKKDFHVNPWRRYVNKIK